MEDANIASAIERGIVRQAQLIASLSLAVIGGLLVLLLQVKFHNVTFPKATIELQYVLLLWLSVGASGIAILIGFLLFGLLIEIAPILYKLHFKEKAFMRHELRNVPKNLLRVLSGLQAIFFLVSVLCGILLIALNQS